MEKYSFLDQDQYKFTMQQGVIQKFPNLKARYKFINRGKTIWPVGMAQKLRERLKEFSETAILTKEEFEYLSSIRFFFPFYLWVLSKFRFDVSEIYVSDNIDDTYVEGYWWRTILWECIFLSMLSELYHEISGHKLPDRNILTKLNMSKGYDFLINNIKVVEAGFRRSNVYFAKKYNLIPIGTVAHEWYMAHSALYGYHEANRKSLENWIKVYNGDLGMALPDTFTSKSFFNIFDTQFAKLFDGFRQDSGNPIEIGNMGLENYYKTIRDKSLIQSKTICFSNSLTSLKEILDIDKEFIDILRSYMIGTWFSCDIPIINSRCGSEVMNPEQDGFQFVGTNFDLMSIERVKPLNIVMKLSHVLVNGVWIPVIKLGDGNGEKYTGDPDQIDLAKRTLNIK